MRVTRLAPSPTGALHLGNARTFLVNWLIARQEGCRVILRIEDLDGPRIKAGADRQAIEDLQWLGLDWDEGPIYQSPRMGAYAAAINALLSNGRAYACVCSRKEVESAASAPHADDGASVYPGTCRGRFRSVEDARVQSGREPAIRFAVPPGIIEFDDRFKGRTRIDVASRLGDFVIAKSMGIGVGGDVEGETVWSPAYQLAVVVDDADMGVTDVVRGDDLLDSSPRQTLLYHALGLADRVPQHCHLPLVVGADGRRLAKRHGDTRLSYYRDMGVPPERVISLVARWCGIDVPPDLKATGVLKILLEQFRLASLPRQAVTFTQDDDLWLRGGRG